MRSIQFSSRDCSAYRLQFLRVKFLKEFITEPAATGAIAPSSTFLAQRMLEGLGLGAAEAVLEYGPGTGALTGHILNQLTPAAKFAAIELNSQFAQIFKTRYPTVPLFQDTVANARDICDYAGISSVDCVICGLPWAAFPEAMQVKCLDEMMRVLKPGGRFVTFAYVHGLPLPTARKFARLLPNYFTSVLRSPVVWLNVPPAFVYRCRR
jgi:phosphatidylethanolamine/phosphatidyl-N-methylethanolamine N-methyltransferase